MILVVVRCHFFVPSFEKNGIFMPGLFFFQSNFGNRNNRFSTKILNIIEVIEFLSSILKNSLPPSDFLIVLGV